MVVDRSLSAGTRRRALLHRVGLWLGVLVLALLACPDLRAAEPPDQQLCLDSYTQSQRLRKAGKLIEARQHLLICSQSQCPAVVTTDCVPWLSELERNLPSIVVAAKGPDGKDTVHVRVLIDDKPVSESLDGRAIPVDPGTHELSFEHHGKAPIVRQLVMQVGQKNRRVEVSFAPPPPTAVAPPPPPPEQAPAERGEPIAGYVLTGVGVLGLGSFALFGLMGKGEADEYEDTCAPTKSCDEDDVSSTETKLLVADISLIVGVAALGVGVGLILYNKLSDPESDAPTARLELRPVLGGASLAWTSAF